MTGTTDKIIKHILLSLVLLIPLIELSAQDQKAENSYLLTGVVLDIKQKTPLPYVTVNVKNTMYGTATDVNGYFSVLLNPGDTLEFTSVGYERASFIMPFELDREKYTLLQLMKKDTLILDEVVVFPWPDYENFAQAFLDTEPFEPEISLVLEVKQDLELNLEKAERSKYYYDQQRYQKLFMMHKDFPPNNFLDPARWSDFIRDLANPDEEN